jgi:hypothetical protein
MSRKARGFRIPSQEGLMKSTAKAAIALTLALLAAIPASGQSLTPPTAPMSETSVSVAPPTPAFVAQAQGPTTNPPAHVRQPGTRTRVVVAIVAGTLIGIGLIVFAHAR